MPYKIKGDKVIRADTGRTIGHSNKPKQYIKVLRAIEQGWTPKVKK